MTPQPPPDPVSSEADARLQRKVLSVLALGQVMSGLGTGATMALGRCS